MYICHTAQVSTLLMASCAASTSTLPKRSAASRVLYIACTPTGLVPKNKHASRLSTSVHQDRVLACLKTERARLKTEHQHASRSSEHQDYARRAHTQKRNQGTKRWHGCVHLPEACHPSVHGVQITLVLLYLAHETAHLLIPFEFWARWQQQSISWQQSNSWQQSISWQQIISMLLRLRKDQRTPLAYPRPRSKEPTNQTNTQTKKYKNNWFFCF